VHLWSDSQIILYWIKSDKKLHQFVSHWVTEIHQLTPNSTWKYCPTEENSADLLIKGITVTQMKSSLPWHQGPQWLTDHNKWPVWQPAATFHLQAATVMTSEFVPTTSLKPCNGLHKIIDLTNYSTLASAVRVTAFKLRFVANPKLKDGKQTGSLKAEAAKMRWVKDCQQQVYYNKFTNACSNPTAATRLSYI